MSSKKLLVSVVIPNFNGRDLLRKNLPLVMGNSPQAKVMVVDDASSDKSVEFVRENFPSVEVVVLDKNGRFARACNEGLSRVKSDVVILLNNDVVPKKGYLEPLLKHFEDEKVFAVGCKEIDSKGRESGRSEGSFRRGFLVHWKAEDQSKNNTLWAAGGSMAVSKKLWDELGGMDEMYKPAYWEDIDLSYRAFKRGYRVVFEPKSMVVHNHETTNKRVFGLKTMQVATFKNQLLFVWKNISDLKFIIRHLLWLPYHLVFTTLRSGGSFFIAFLWAVTQLPSAILGRVREARHRVVGDSKILLRT